MAQRPIPGLAVVLVGLATVPVSAQVPWDVFADPQSDSVCDVVNAANLEFVVITETGELAVVTEKDFVLPEDAGVDPDGVFFFGGIPIGEVAFAFDGDDFRTLWLLAPDDTVLELDPVTGEPIFTDLFPEDFVSVPCDAFELWDDDDFDGVEDAFDDCPETPLGEPVDDGGCACFEVDSDEDGLDDCDDECPFDPSDDITGCPCEVFDEDDDGINDCFDDCPGTPPGENVDEDGCEGVVIVNPPPVVVACGSFSTLALMSTLCGLLGMRFASRRRVSC
jgi:hypothetical protein